VVHPVDGGYYLTQIQPIFDRYCVACHKPSNDTQWLYERLVNVPADCNTGIAKVRVQPGSAGTSLLYLKISNDPARCGTAEPQGQLPLIQQDPAATQKIRDWINNGADAN
jgi:hypothetical protein